MVSATKPSLQSAITDLDTLLHKIESDEKSSSKTSDAESTASIWNTLNIENLTKKRGVNVFSTNTYAQDKIGQILKKAEKIQQVVTGILINNSDNSNLRTIQGQITEINRAQIECQKAKRSQNKKEDSVEALNKAKNAARSIIEAANEIEAKIPDPTETSPVTSQVSPTETPTETSPVTSQVSPTETPTETSQVTSPVTSPAPPSVNPTVTPKEGQNVYLTAFEQWGKNTESWGVKVYHWFDNLFCGLLDKLDVWVCDVMDQAEAEGV